MVLSPGSFLLEGHRLRHSKSESDGDSPICQVMGSVDKYFASMSDTVFV